MAYTHFVLELQRDLELERRKAVTLQESLKEREKEYQKLKAINYMNAPLFFASSFPLHSHNTTKSSADLP